MWKVLADFLGIMTVPDPPASMSARAPAGQAGRRMDRRTRYIRTQALQLAQRFSRNGGPGILLDEENYDWLIIPRYPMPERWAQRWTQLMLVLPEGYPDVPPTGFYLKVDLGKPRKFDKHVFFGGGMYPNAPDLSKGGWYWYCVHVAMQESGGWKPGADPEAPDNLFTYLNVVREALTNHD